MQGIIAPSRHVFSFSLVEVDAAYLTEAVSGHISALSEFLLPADFH